MEKKIRRVLLGVLLVICSQEFLPAGEIPSTAKIRILSVHHPSSLLISSSNGKIYLPEGTAAFSGQCGIMASGAVLRYEKNGYSVSADMVRIEAENIRISVSGAENRNYSGAVEIYPDGRELLVVNDSPLEAYVHGAALSESAELLEADYTAARGWDKEFLSAMEICIRSFITSGKRRHKDPRYSFCDLTHCVHFSGLAEGQPQTKGTVLTDAKAKTICAYFHSTCGGHLSSPSVLWPGASVGNFRTGNDEAEGQILCGRSPHYRWRSFVPMQDMKALFGIAPISVRLSPSQGRVFALIAESGDGEKSIPAGEFLSAAGRRLGWNVIKSNDFSVTKTGEGFLFEGRGLGHGIGLCQYGACALAKKGWNAEKILRFYFPGSVLRDGRR